MIRLTIMVCFPPGDEELPVDWERETQELINIPGVEAVFWAQNAQGEANHDAVAMIDFKSERAYHKAQENEEYLEWFREISKAEGFACLCTEMEEEEE